MALIDRFWRWYERHYVVNISIAVGLFVLQIIHLIWLAGDVIALRLSGEAVFNFNGIWKALFILVDYTEIPAIISVSLVYIYELRKKWSVKSFIYLVFLNVQWLHLFWITDEFVVSTFTNNPTLPSWLAWIAILIDYLEVPVIIETVRKLLQAIKEKKAREFLLTSFKKD